MKLKPQKIQKLDKSFCTFYIDSLNHVKRNFCPTFVSFWQKKRRHKDVPSKFINKQKTDNLI